jgi:hypothetical protein
MAEIVLTLGVPDRVAVEALSDAFKAAVVWLARPDFTT